MAMIFHLLGKFDKSMLLYYTIFFSVTFVSFGISEKQGVCSTNSSQACYQDQDCPKKCSEIKSSYCNIIIQDCLSRSRSISDYSLGTCIFSDGYCSISHKLTCNHDFECPVVCCPSYNISTTITTLEKKYRKNLPFQNKNACLQERCIHRRNRALMGEVEPSSSIPPSEKDNLNVIVIPKSDSSYPSKEPSSHSSEEATISRSTANIIAPSKSDTLSPFKPGTISKGNSTFAPYVASTSKKKKKTNKKRKKINKKRKKKHKKKKRKKKKKKKKKRKKKKKKKKKVKKEAKIDYRPGDLTIYENGLLLSSGLKSKIIARSGEQIFNEPFHLKPDGAACFSTDDGWVYVNNSEERDNGGVGAIYFDSNGEIIDYKRLLSGTRRNCSGGKTPWNTYVSCEEYSWSGQCWEVDPQGKHEPSETVLGGDGGSFESVTVDYRNPNRPHIFVTEDKACGALRRFTPFKDIVKDAIDTNNYWKLLANKGDMEYLVLKPGGDLDSGRFYWSQNILKGRRSAYYYFPNAEGIDSHNGNLYFVAKKYKHLFILNLDDKTYTRSSTNKGLFDGKPDQIISSLDENGLLYFTEDTNDGSGIHARDINDNFFTIIKSVDYDEETTGFALSPNNMFIYFCIQVPGVCFMVYRKDGYSFIGKTLDIKYHTLSTTIRERSLGEEGDCDFLF